MVVWICGQSLGIGVGWSENYGLELLGSRASVAGLIGLRGLLSSAVGEVAITLEAFVTWRLYAQTWYVEARLFSLSRKSSSAEVALRKSPPLALKHMSAYPRGQ